MMFQQEIDKLRVMFTDEVKEVNEKLSTSEAELEKMRHFRSEELTSSFAPFKFDNFFSVIYWHAR